MQYYCIFSFSLGSFSTRYNDDDDDERSDDDEKKKKTNIDSGKPANP